MKSRQKYLIKNIRIIETSKGVSVRLKFRNHCNRQSRGFTVFREKRDKKQVATHPRPLSTPILQVYIEEKGVLKAAGLNEINEKCKYFFIFLQYKAFMNISIKFTDKNKR